MVSLFFMKCKVKPLIEREKEEERAQMSGGGSEDVGPSWVSTRDGERVTETEFRCMSNCIFQSNIT